MSTEERKNLLAQANELGLEFKSNISSVKLAELIAESQSPAIKDDAVDDQEDKPTATTSLTKVQRRRKFIADRKAKAMKKLIVTITNKDNRENDFTTTAPLSFENQHFSLAKNVPLDVPVELEQVLIDIAKSTMITHHKDEIVEGRRTGNKVAIQVKKYVVSYSQETPSE